MKSTITYIAAAFAILCAGAVQTVPAKDSVQTKRTAGRQKASALVYDPKTAVQGGGGISLLKPNAKPAKRPTAVVDPLHQWKDDEVFLDVAGVDKLKWRHIREQIEEDVDSFPANPGMDAEARQNAKAIVFQMKLSKLIKKYLMYSIIAVEARRLGLKADPAEMKESRDNSRRMFATKGERGRKQIRLMDEPDSFYSHNLENVLLWREYAKTVVEPTIVVSNAEVEARIALQHEANLAVLATNEFKRALIEDICRKVGGGSKDAEMEFSAAAEKWSECPSADAGGVITDENEQPQNIAPGDMRPEIEKAYAAMKPGEISGVVETPYSWHVVKLLKENTDEEGRRESVNIAHIMLEKAMLKPEITAEQARRKLINAQVRIEMTKRFLDLMNTTKIDCLVPIRSKDDGAKGRVKGPRKRIVKE